MTIEKTMTARPGEALGRVDDLDPGLREEVAIVAHLLPGHGAASSMDKAEQFIAQHLPLLAPDDRIFTPTYWLREGRANNAEVDFVQQFGPDIAPIEVKAGKSGSLKSLLELVAMRGYGRALRFDTNPPALQHVSHTRTHGDDAVEFTLLSLPLYMVEQTARLWRNL